MRKGRAGAFPLAPSSYPGARMARFGAWLLRTMLPICVRYGLHAPPWTVESKRSLREVRVRVP